MLIILGRKQQRLCEHLQNRYRAEHGGQRGAEHLLETTSHDTLVHPTLRALCLPLPSPACHTREWFFPKSLSSEELTNPILSRPRQHASPLTRLEADQTPTERFLELESEEQRSHAALDFAGSDQATSGGTATSR